MGRQQISTLTKQKGFSFSNRIPKVFLSLNPFSANLTKWSNTLKQFVANLPTDCLSVFDNFVGLVLKGFKGVSVVCRLQVKR